MLTFNKDKENGMNNENWKRYNLEGLPESMLAHLRKAPHTNDRDAKILSLVQTQFNGAASIDEIWVALYRETQKEVKRNVIGAAMRRLVEQGKLQNVRKGCYATQEWVDTHK